MAQDGEIVGHVVLTRQLAKPVENNEELREQKPERKGPEGTKPEVLAVVMAAAGAIEKKWEGVEHFGLSTHFASPFSFRCHFIWPPLSLLAPYKV